MRRRAPPFTWKSPAYPASPAGQHFSAAHEEIDLAVKVSQTVVPLGFGFSEPAIDLLEPSQDALY